MFNFQDFTLCCLLLMSVPVSGEDNVTRPVNRTHTYFRQQKPHMPIPKMELWDYEDYEEGSGEGSGFIPEQIRVSITPTKSLPIDAFIFITFPNSTRHEEDTKSGFTATSTSYIYNESTYVPNAVSATSKDPITSTYLPPQVSSITTEVKPVAEYDDEYYDNEYTSTPRSYTSITNQSTVLCKANSTINRTFDGDVSFLNSIVELADEVVPNTHYKDEDLTYSSYMTNVGEYSTNITWQDKTINGPEVALLEYAVHQLNYSRIKMVTIKEKNKSQLLGDIVVIKTETVKESLSEHVLQIKFEKKNIPYPYNTNWTCVYWDIEILKWSVGGIVTKFEPEFIICLSRHLSTFSILLPDPGQILFNNRYEEDSKHKVWLTNISRIGSCITIFFLILVIIINYKKKTGRETRKIFINSSLALLLTHGTYQIHTFLDGLSKCLVVSFMKYYFVLAFLLWTAADGINMWRLLLTSVFNTEGHIFYKWYKIIAWGVPLITTFIGLLFTKSHRTRECKLQFNKTYDLIFYLVPCVIILCCNMLLFTWMVLNLANKNLLGKLKDKKINYVLALTQIFGIGWCVVFPFLYFKSTQLLAEFLLAGVISTQGLLIFIVRGGVVKNFGKKLRNGSFCTTTYYVSHTQQQSISTVELDAITSSNTRTS